MLRFKLTGRLDKFTVPLAILSGADLSRSNNIATIDLAHKIPENIVSHTGSAFSISATPDIIEEDNIACIGFTISEGLRSSRIVVTNKASLSKDNEPISLFYKYTIGRGQFGIYVAPDIDMTTDNFKLFMSHLDSGDPMPTALQHYKYTIGQSIKDAISISTKSSNSVLQWDIEDIKPVITDVNDQLYGRVYTVTLLTSRRNRNGITYVLSYNAYNKGQRNIITGKSEVINSVPVATIISSSIITDTDSGIKTISVKVKTDEKFANILN